MPDDRQNPENPKNPDFQTGECRCARVRFQVDAKPAMTMACHCTGCQKMTASAFSLSALYPASAFRIVHGETVLGGLQGAHRHHFCAFCKGWLFTVPAGMDDWVNVRATLLDNAQGFVPFIETCTREKLPWVQLPVTHSFGGFPEPEQFHALGKAFAQAADKGSAGQQAW